MTPYYLAGAVLLLGILYWVSHPYGFLRSFLWLARHTSVRLRITFDAPLPQKGGVLLIANHVSILDAVWMLGITRRPIRFMVHQDFFRIAPLRWLFRYLGVLRVPAANRPRELQIFFMEVRALLERGEAVCMFPEGGVSDNGYLQSFRDGVSEILPGDSPIPLIPVRLGMIWGRLFSIDGKRIVFTPLFRFPILVSILVGKPISPALNSFALRQHISEMGAEAEMMPFYAEKTIHAAFVGQCKRHPLRIAYKDFEGTGVRNVSMLARAMLFAGFVRELDRENPNPYIGVLLPNSTIEAVAFFAIMLCNKVPAVLNYTTGAAIRAAVVERSGIKVILTSRKFIEKLKIEPTPEMVFLEDLAPKITKKMKFRALTRALCLPASRILRGSGGDLHGTAVLLFSSGSTGIPKGVLLSHHNLNSNIMSFWRVIDWKRTDRVIGNLPLFHAYGFMVNFAFPAVSGTRVVYLRNPLEGGQVAKLVEREKITMMMATPTFLQNYLRKATKEQYRTIRLAITGAEKMRRDIAEEFHAFCGLALIEGFGCTELSPIVAINLSSSFFRFGREAGKEGSVGAPLPGVHVKIVDPATNAELPPDTPGLLLVKGGNVMKGYLNDPEATAAVLQNGYYNTGDVAMMGTDGSITITGRLSRFSKIAGEMVPHEKVEQEINEVLHSCERVVAVCGAADPKRGEKLVVFYLRGALEIPPLLEALRTRGLSNLWIPKADDFHPMDAMPLLGSGKLDIQKLKQWIAELK